MFIYGVLGFVEEVLLVLGLYLLFLGGEFEAGFHEDVIAGEIVVFFLLLFLFLDCRVFYGVLAAFSRLDFGDVEGIELGTDSFAIIIFIIIVIILLKLLLLLLEILLLLILLLRIIIIMMME